MLPFIAIHWTSDEDEKEALQLSKNLCIPTSQETIEALDYYLELKQGQLFLTPLHKQLPCSKPFTVDFTKSSIDYRRQKSTVKNEAIARALGLNTTTQTTVIDATAGWGTDAFLLASLGCEVLMLEKTPIIATLLKYGLEYGLKNEKISETLSRLSLRQADSITYIENINSDTKPDVIYCDPMFPATDKTALVKKDMQIIQQLTHSPEADDRLLSVSLLKAKKRVVIKRPNSAPFLNNMPPSHQVRGKKYRFDIYVTLNDST